MRKKLTAKEITTSYKRLKLTKRPKLTTRLLEEVAMKMLEGVQDAPNN
jgi:hypothetical protein